jgi:hypothetical protein
MAEIAMPSSGHGRGRLAMCNVRAVWIAGARVA